MFSDLILDACAWGKLQKIKGMKPEQVYAKARAAAQREVQKIFGKAWGKTGLSRITALQRRCVYGEEMGCLPNVFGRVAVSIGSIVSAVCPLLQEPC